MKKIVLTLGLLALGACDKPASTESKVDDPAAKNTPTTTNAPAAASANTATNAAAAAQPVITIEESDLSTPADFEESAEKAITPKTYKVELAALETDIGKE